MAVTWDSKKWLEKNYVDDNGIPGLFIQGAYLPNQRDIAENEYRETVQLLSSSEVKKCSEWAIKTMNSGYLPVGQKQLGLSCHFLRISNHPKHPGLQERPKKATTMPQIQDIVETDNITLPGLNVSLLSFLKTNAANKAYMYYNYDSESQYRIASVMNNILDLTDISANKKC